jgi:ribosomal-protein-alanine N-acetyltransferase
VNSQSANPVDTISIRSMSSADLEQVLAIDRMSFSMPWPASAYIYELDENPLSLLWVAENGTADDEKQIVGMAVAWLILDEAHIATLAVHPDYRGQGIARRLLAVALKEAILKGMKEATLEVRANNLAAQNLYRQFGFEIVGSRPRYYKDNHEDALIMTVHALDSSYIEWLEMEALYEV